MPSTMIISGVRLDRVLVTKLWDGVAATIIASCMLKMMSKTNKYHWKQTHLHMTRMQVEH